MSRSPATLWQPRGGIEELHLDGSQHGLQHGLMLNDGLFMALLQVAAILPQVNWTPANSAHSLLAMPAVMRLGSHPPDGTCCTMLHI